MFIFIKSMDLYAYETRTTIAEKDTNATSSKTLSNDSLLTKNKEFSRLLGIGYIVSFPQSSFSGEVHSVIKGVDIYYWIAPPNIHLAYGVDISVMNYGSEKTTIHGGIGYGSQQDITYSTKYNIIAVLFSIRYQWEYGIIAPYIDGLMGVNCFYTTSEGKFENGSYEGTYFQTDIGYTDAAPCFGLGTGLTIKIIPLRPDIRNGVLVGYHDALNIDVGVRYLFGSRLKYLREGSMFVAKDTIGNETASYIPSESRTDRICLQVGFSFKF